MKKITIYTDGAASPYSTKDYSMGFYGGAGIVIIDENNNVTNKFTYSSKKTTNNRMELEAVIKAMQIASSNQEIDAADIYTDSAYIVNCIKDGWYKKWCNNGWITSKKTPVENVDLWKRLLQLLENAPNLNLALNILKVKGHSNNEYNNIADTLAVYGKLNPIEALYETWRELGEEDNE